MSDLSTSYQKIKIYLAKNMKFKLNFDGNIYTKQMDLLFDLAWKEKIAYYKNSHFLGIFFLVIGSLITFERPSFFWIRIFNSIRLLLF